MAKKNEASSTKAPPFRRVSDAVMCDDAQPNTPLKLLRTMSTWGIFFWTLSKRECTSLEEAGLTTVGDLARYPLDLIYAHTALSYDGYRRLPAAKKAAGVDAGDERWEEITVYVPREVLRAVSGFALHDAVTRLTMDSPEVQRALAAGREKKRQKLADEIARKQAQLDALAEGDFGAQSVIVTGGMSLRDYFAAAALTGLLASAHGTITAKVIACEALAVADAMIEARTENGGE